VNKSILDLLEQRYLYEYVFEDGTVFKETVNDMFFRVSKKVASAFFNRPFFRNNKTSTELAVKYCDTFYENMKSGNFLPSSPQLMNALRMFGLKKVERSEQTGETQLIFEKEIVDITYKPAKEMTAEEWETVCKFVNSKSAFGSCYATGRIKDSLDDIYDSLGNQAEIFRASGGYGTSFSSLRNSGSLVKSTLGTSCGPLGYMQLFNKNTELIALNGKQKRGANLFSLDVSHPDIEAFIESKNKLITRIDKDGNEQLVPEQFEFANLSVELTDEFMEAVEQDNQWDLKDPSTGETVKTVRAKSLLEKIAKSNWETGEPGILMFDNANRFNHFKGFRNIQSSNPCGEFLSYDNTVCNLLSVNLYNMLKENAEMDYEKLEQTVEIGTFYLNLALFANTFPTQGLTMATRENRPIGLGFMGLASVFMRQGYKYGSKETIEEAEEITERMMRSCIRTSCNIANSSRYGIGTFKNYGKSSFVKGDFYFKNRFSDEITQYLAKGIANSRLMAIAPTGSISQLCAGLISDASALSGGLEPIYSLSYTRIVNPGRNDQYKITQDDVCIKDILRKDHKKTEKAAKKIIEKIGTRWQSEIFNEPRFTTAMQLTLDDHLEMLKTISDRIDMSCSKTINLPNETTVEEIAELYKKVYKMELKGVTTFRDGCRQGVLETKKTKRRKKTAKYKEHHKGYLIDIQSGIAYCPNCKAEQNKGFVLDSGCAYCSECGWGACK